MTHPPREPETAIPEDLIDAAAKLCCALGVASTPMNCLPIIEAFKADRQRDQWRDMSTAPKRGHVILALPNGQACEGYWGLARYNRSSKTYDEAWVTSPYSGDVQPTHWMPLPASPKTEG